MKTVVTGGAGFIGHHLVKALLTEGHEVTVLDNYATGSADRLADVQSDIRMVAGDVRDTGLVSRALDGAEVVFHEAALPSVPRSLAEPQASSSVNIGGTIEVLLGAASAGVRRVILASSSSVYGDTPGMPRRETQRLSPLSPYAASKAAAEYMLHSLGAHHHIETVALRYFNVFGPGQDPKSQYAAVVPRWISAAIAGERPVLFGDGSASRDFTYVDNVVNANLLAAQGEFQTGDTFNVACGEEYTLLDLLEAIGNAVGKQLDPEVRPSRPGDVQHSLADITRARDAMGYQVVTPFRPGVEATVRWYQST